MTTHARLAPSAAHRWMRCSGSVALEATMPDTSGEYADEGTKAHDVAAQVLRGVDWLKITGVNEEMIEAVGRYTDYVKTLAGNLPLSIEQKVDFSDAIGVPESYGTADCIIHGPDYIHLVDLKYGRGVKVDAQGNEQLLLYALGALNEFGFLGDIKVVRMSIVQPRLDHVSEWEVDRDELEEFRTRVVVAADVALNGEEGEPRDFNPGEKQCRFCKAKAICPALARKTTELVTDSFEDLTAKAVEHSIGTMYGALPQMLSHYLDHVDLIETWCKAVREEAYRRLAEGQELPGYKLVAGKKGARAWSDPAEAEKTLKSMRLKSDLMYDYKLISPTSAEKLFKAGEIGERQWPKLRGLITQSDGKPHVAPNTDPRPAITIAAAPEEFEAFA